MKNYLAPMEGVTNWVYRNAYHDCFYPMDKYFTPFITAKPNKRLSSKEIKEVSPETNGDQRRPSGDPPDPDQQCGGFCENSAYLPG